MIPLERAEERKQLQLYIIRALDADKDTFTTKRIRGRESAFARNLYSYYCSLLEMIPANAAKELNIPPVVFYSYRHNMVRILEHNKNLAQIYAEACQRIQTQLLDPEREYLFPQLFTWRNLETRARREREANDFGFPSSVRYKSPSGFINHMGEIVLRP